MNTEDLAYLAGIVDGEGCITIFRANRTARPSYRLALVIVMNNPEPIELFSNIFGGTVAHHPSMDNAKSLRYAIYGWHAGKVLAELMPYIRVKKQEVELAMQFCYAHSGSRGQHISDMELNLKDELYHKMKELKH